MKLKAIEEKECGATFSVEVPSEIVKAKEAEVAGTFQKAAHLPGFRPGKAPLSIIQKNFSEKIKHKVLEQLVQDALSQIVKEKSLHTVSNPVIKQIQYNGGNSLSFNLVIEHSPQFKVKNYSRIPVVKKTSKITETDVEKELKHLQERNAHLFPSKSEKAEQNHFAVIDYCGSLNNKPIAELKAENQLMDLAAPQFIEGFAEGVLGLALGESKEIAVQLPKEYPQKELAGNAVAFKVTLRSLKEKLVPGLDDEFAKDLGFATLQELKTKIMESLQKVMEKNSTHETERQIQDHLIQENPISVPDSLTRLQEEYLIHRLLLQEGIPKEKWEETQSALRGKYRSQAERHVRISYLLNGIAQQENLKATPEELNAEMENAQNANPEKKEDLKQYFDEHRSTLLNRMTDEKVMKFLLEHAKIKEVSE